MPKGETKNKFVYDGEVGKHLWYDGNAQHPWEFKRIWGVY